MLINRVATTPVDVPRGLAGVVVTDTSLGDVRGQEGFYHYRQYSAVELARTRDFEDVWHLMVHGELPDVARRTAFADRVRPLRRLPDDVQAALPAIATASARSGPLSGLRTALSLFGASKGFRPVYDLDADRRRADALAASAAVPTLLTALYRLGQGLDPIEPRDDLPYAANYLYMLTGSEPDTLRARAVEQYLISTIDHGFNASTFTARVIARTWPRASWAPWVPSPAPSTAVRRAAPWTPSMSSAPPIASTPGSVNVSTPVTASWASVTPCTAPRTLAPACFAASRSSSVALGSPSRWRWNARSSRSSPS